MDDRRAAPGGVTRCGGIHGSNAKPYRIFDFGWTPGRHCLGAGAVYGSVPASVGNAVPVRNAICRACAWLGLELDEAANREHRTRISMPKSRVAAYVIKTDENLMIARHARALVGS